MIDPEATVQNSITIYRCIRKPATIENPRKINRLTHQYPHFDVSSCKLKPMSESLGFAIDPVIFTDILVKSPHSKLAFLLSKPSSCPREVW